MHQIVDDEGRLFGQVSGTEDGGLGDDDIVAYLDVVGIDDDGGTDVASAAYL